MAKKLVFEQFDNLTKFSKALERSTNAVFRGEYLSSKRERSGGWAGTRTYEEAMDLFNNGWDEKVAEIKKGLVQFEKANEKNVSYQKSRPATSVVGFAPHVPNAILGLPNSMIMTESTPMKAKAVRIIYNMSMNANTDAEDILQAGLCVLKIAYSMEMKGYRVRIDVSPFTAKSGRENTSCVVCVKDWRQHIDIKKVAFPIANPAMFRRLGFRWIETTPNLTDTGYTGGYGQSFENAEEEKKILTDAGVLDEKDYYLNVPLAKRNSFNVDKVAKAIGIKNF